MTKLQPKLLLCLCINALCLTAFAQLPSYPLPSAPLPDAPSTTAHDLPPAVPTGPTVVFDTTMGRLVCKLFSKETPVTTANFIALATGSKPWTDPVTQQKVTNKPYYDGTTFHRVVPGFMIQGGDRLGTGSGDAGYYIADEFDPGLRFDGPGRLAMANAGPGTGGSQFFITEAPAQELNGKHTIFGECDPHTVLLVSSIARVERNANDKPITPVYLVKVTIVPVGQPMPPLPAYPPVANPVPDPKTGVVTPGPQNIIPAGASPISPPPGTENRRPPQ